MIFKIHLKDQNIEFNDIIDLSEEQQETINSTSSSKSMSDWHTAEEGIKVPLEEWQCDVVLAHKKSLVSGKEEKALYKDGTFIFTKHAKARVALRVDKADSKRPPKLDSIILVIKLVIESKLVDPVAEWKGYKNLVYTLIHKENGEKFKISVSFEKIGNEHVKIITVSNEHIDQLTQSLIDKPEIKEYLERIKKTLFETQVK